MTKAYQQIPIHESEWMKFQDPEDVFRFSQQIANMGNDLAKIIQGETNTTFDQFITGALNEMDTLNIATRGYKKTIKSSFRFLDQKNEGEDVSIFMVGDNTRAKADAKLFSTVLSNAQKEWVRHPNIKKPITVYLNEINNTDWPDIGELFSWCRAYKVHLRVYIQHYFGFEQKHSKFARKALQSESGITLFLPNQTDPETLKDLESALGTSSYTSVTNSGKRTGDGALTSYNISEQSKPLMPKNQIRQLDGYGVLFLGNKKPALVRLRSIAAIWPFRHWQGISPFYGKKYRLPIKLVIWRYAPFMPAVLISKAKIKLRKALANRKNKS